VSGAYPETTNCTYLTKSISNTLHNKRKAVLSKFKTTRKQENDSDRFGHEGGEEFKGPQASWTRKKKRACPTRATRPGPEERNYFKQGCADLRLETDSKK